MEVASPLAFSAPAGTKRSLACSPQLMETTNHANSPEEDVFQRAHKRRRFHADTSVESLSSAFSSPSGFFNDQMQMQSKLGSPFGPTAKRNRSGSSSPIQSDLQHVVQEQAAMIESLKKEKTTVEESYGSLKSDRERISKENHVLRRAVQIQQDRQNQAEGELKNAHKYKIESDDKIKKLEHMIMSLRYHLQAQQAPVPNDFMNQSPRPPDVY